MVGHDIAKGRLGEMHVLKQHLEKRSQRYSSRVVTEFKLTVIKLNRKWGSNLTGVGLGSRGGRR